MRVALALLLTAFAVVGASAVRLVCPLLAAVVALRFGGCVGYLAGAALFGLAFLVRDSLGFWQVGELRRRIRRKVFEAYAGTRFLEQTPEEYLQAARANIMIDRISEYARSFGGRFLIPKHADAIDLGGTRPPFVRIFLHDSSQTPVGAPAPTPYFGFESPFHSSFVFTSVGPSDAVGPRLFFILHEIGHAIHPSRTLLRQRLRSWRTTICVAAFCFMCAADFKPSLILTALTSMTLVGLCYAGSVVWQESSADAFAVGTIDEAALRRLKDGIAAHPGLIYDRSLGSTERSRRRRNDARLRNLQRLISWRLNDPDSFDRVASLEADRFHSPPWLIICSGTVGALLLAATWNLGYEVEGIVPWRVGLVFVLGLVGFMGTVLWAEIQKIHFAITSNAEETARPKRW